MDVASGDVNGPAKRCPGPGPGKDRHLLKKMLVHVGDALMNPTGIPIQRAQQGKFPFIFLLFFGRRRGRLSGRLDHGLKSPPGRLCYSSRLDHGFSDETMIAHPLSKKVNLLFKDPFSIMLKAALCF